MKSRYFVNFVVFFVLIGVVFLIYQYWYTPNQKSAELSANISGSSLILEGAATNTDNMANIENEVSQVDNSIEGLKIEVLKQGTGQAAKNGDEVEVHYTGVLENGVKFDSSVDRGAPFSFNLGAGGVIQGWDLGVLGMKVGEKRKLTIAPSLGYGERAVGSIPANSTLIFDVELLRILP